MSYRIIEKKFRNAPTIFSVYHVYCAYNDDGYKEECINFSRNFENLDSAKNFIKTLELLEYNNTLVSETVVYDTAS